MTDYPSYTKQQLIDLADATSPHEAIELIADEVRERFPYKSYSVSLEAARASLRRLSSYEPTIVARTYPSPIERRFDLCYEPLGAPALIVCRRTDYANHNVAIERYGDVVRVEARKETRVFSSSSARQDRPDRRPRRRRGGGRGKHPHARQHQDESTRVLNPSPREYFERHTFEVVCDAIECLERVDAHSLREAVYHLAEECTEVRTSVCVALCRHFAANRVLDFCAGRGSRLLAAIAVGASYVGVDPDARVHDVYARVLEELVPVSDRSKYMFVRAPFEDTTTEQLLGPSGERFDLVLTSPPYFALEVYGEDETQSLARYPRLDDWLERFMLPCLTKAWALLARGGHLALILSDYGDVRYMERVVAHCSRLDDAEQLGVLSYAEVKGDARDGELLTRAQPVWCWRKAI
jgi:16S rRNA G966 N2-methylase RsmD